MRLKLFLLIFLAVLQVGCSRIETTLHDAQDHEIKLSDLKGKWIIINYWADWCDTCVVEIPELNKFYSHNQNKSVLLFGVNYDHLPSDQLKQTIAKRHINYPVLADDPNSIWKLGAMDAIPMTFIIGPDNKIKKIIVGATTEQSLIEMLRVLQA